jgi:putative peptidoglycan lipid II flippase
MLDSSGNYCRENKQSKMSVFKQKYANNKECTNRMSINRQILSASVVVTVGTLLVKLIAFFKESIVAWKFGTDDVVDAFLIATIIPELVITVVAGSLNAALIPTYIKVREEDGSKVAEQLLSGATLCSLALLGIATLFIIIMAPLYLPWMTLGFRTEKLALTFKLLYAISPLILLNSMIVLFRAVLNAEERFVIGAVSPVLTPSVTMILLLLGGHSIGIFALAIGLVVGAILEVTLLGAAIMRNGVKLQAQWFGFTPALKQVIKLYLPAITGSFLMYSTILVDQSMAAMLVPGSVAALNYASRVSLFPILLSSTVISAVVIPYFSKLIALNDWHRIDQIFRSYLKLIFLITVPLTGLLILCSDPIIQLLFQRGAFTAKETHLTAQILAAYALQIPFYIAGMLVVKLLTSLRLNHVLMWVSVYNLIINIGLNYFFLQLFGIQGIALSTSCVYLFSFCYLLFFAVKNLNKFSEV